MYLHGIHTSKDPRATYSWVEDVPDAVAGYDEELVPVQVEFEVQDVRNGRHDVRPLLRVPAPKVACTHTTPRPPQPAANGKVE